MKIIFVLLNILPVAFVVNQGCTSGKEKNTGEAPVKDGYITESINPYDQTERRYGDDSVYVYKNGVLLYVNYLDSLNPVWKVTFRANGRIRCIEYRPSIYKDSLMDEFFYDDSARTVSLQTFYKDTVIYSGNNPMECNKLIISYYQNGQMQIYGYYGPAFGYNIADTSIGVQKYYSEDGLLEKTQESIFSFDYEPYTIIKTYYKNGNVKQEEQYLINWKCLESDEEWIPRGTWKYYNENGELIKKKEYEEYKPGKYYSSQMNHDEDEDEDEDTMDDEKN